MSDGAYTTVIVLIFVFMAIVFVGLIAFIIWKKKDLDSKIDGLAKGTEELTPEEFFKLRNYSFGGRGSPSYVKKKNFAGVYIIYNKTKNMYYVGQAQKILDRVNNHFVGRGNGDVYADYKYGDKFTIKMISLQNSGFSSLNELERCVITKYNAFSKGYNKTRGNR